MARGLISNHKIEGATIDWAFINPLMKAQYGVDAMPQTAGNVADYYRISRADQYPFAVRSQRRAAAQAAGFLAEEIVAVMIKGGRGDTVVEQDEHLRPDTGLEALGKLKPVKGEGKTVIAGNASGVNDGAAALILASAEAVKKARPEPSCPGAGYGQRRRGTADHGLRPGTGGTQTDAAPGLGDQRLRCDRTQRSLCRARIGGDLRPRSGRRRGPGQSQWRCHRLGHPLGMSGARLVLTALRQLERSGGKRGGATMCVSQGLALAVERV